MSTLATYKSLLIEKIAQSSTTFHTNQSRIDAINEAILNICMAYDIPQMMKKASLTFTSGLASPPTDFLRLIKLWTSANSTLIEFEYVPEDIFDNFDPTSAEYFWTLDYDTSSSSRKLMIVPTSVTSTTIRYVKQPTTLVNDSDDSGLPIFFDDSVAYWAGTILLRNEGNVQKAMDMDKILRQVLMQAYQLVMKNGGAKQGLRLRSRYEKYPITNEVQSP